jgi:hypothetical protein
MAIAPGKPRFDRHNHCNTDGKKDQDNFDTDPGRSKKERER